MTPARPVLRASGLGKTFGSGATLVRATDGVDLERTGFLPSALSDRLISMRDGVFVDETRMTGGSRVNLGRLIGLGGE